MKKSKYESNDNIEKVQGGTEEKIIEYVCPKCDNKISAKVISGTPWCCNTKMYPQMLD